MVEDGKGFSNGKRSLFIATIISLDHQLYNQQLIMNQPSFNHGKGFLMVVSRGENAAGWWFSLKPSAAAGGAAGGPTGWPR